ncbi:MAG: carboxypeptidase regulatory-like domain-containing protein, partial [Blastocatellia bacterium]|nr:carboxypeptidase regulatory-like domain-containing protein [Blastocatellia bacterium]
MRYPIAFVALCSTLILSLGTVAQAQSQITTGVIQGTVKDESGAIIAGAAVEVKNLDNNITKILKTDENGRYVFLQLQPGRYTLTIGRQGYAMLVQENLSLTVGQTIN